MRSTAKNSQSSSLVRSWWGPERERWRGRRTQCGRVKKRREGGDVSVIFLPSFFWSRSSSVEPKKEKKKQGHPSVSSSSSHLITQPWRLTLLSGSWVVENIRLCASPPGGLGRLQPAGGLPCCAERQGRERRMLRA